MTIVWATLPESSVTSPSSAAAMVTVCGAFQLSGVKVNRLLVAVVPPLIVKSALAGEIETSKTTLLAGRVSRTTS